MMQNFLGLEGFEVRTAVSLSEGLNGARKGYSDLYLMDFEFPDGTGAEPSANGFARSILLHPLFFAPVLHIHLNESKRCRQGPTPTL
jgi:hypothetical protein